MTMKHASNERTAAAAPHPPMALEAMPESEKMQNFTFKMPRDLIDQLKEIARRNGKRYQTVTRQVLTEYVRTKQTP